MEKQCKNCAYAHKRVPYDLRFYGSSGFAYECTRRTEGKNHTTYKRLYDSCEYYKEKENGYEK